MMTQTILTEKANPNTTNIDMMDSYQIAQTINQEDQKIAIAIEKELPQIAKAIDLIVDSFQQGGRLAYFGAGTSGRLGVLDASEMLPTFGVADQIYAYIAGGNQALRHPVEGAEDSEELAREDLNLFNPQPQDVVVAISASGNAKYNLNVLKLAHKKGCQTIGISSNPAAKIKEFSDIFICPILGEEAITGSSRMKSGTAQKMILNMISTATMIRLGKVYHNLMIDVQTTNVKLVDRGIRIISEIGGTTYDQAKDYLAKSNNNVKIACVMAVKQCSCEQATTMLAQQGGILRKVIE